MIIKLYGNIDENQLSARYVAEHVDKAKGDIELKINSYGGSVFEALAIVNILRGYDGGHITAVVDGVAASSASFVAVAGSDKLVMRPNAELMIHNAWAGSQGDYRDFAKTGEQLKKTSEKIANIYAEKAGTDVGVWLDMMNEETWFSAEEAVKAGLADEVIDAKKTPHAKDARNEAIPGVMVLAHYSREEAGKTPKILDKQGNYDMEFIKKLAELLGLSPDKEHTEEEVLEALKEVLAEQADDNDAEDTEAKNENTDDIKDEVDAVQDIQKTELDSRDSDSESDTESDSGESDDVEDEADGEELTVTVSAAYLKQLKADAAFAAQAKEQDRQNKATEFAESLYASNKIVASEKSKWMNFFIKDAEEAQAEADKIPDNMIPRAELGHVVEANLDELDEEIENKAKESILEGFTIPRINI